MSKNYYETLGVNKNASADEIKKAYKKMAMKYHPDRNKWDASAEKKFKEVNEAYQVLGDEQKKKNYDQFWSADFGGFGWGNAWGNPFGWGFGGGSYSSANFDFGDLFSQFGGGKSSQSGWFNFDFGDLFGGWSRKQSEPKTQQKASEKENLDVTETVEIPFFDFLFDTKVSVKSVYNKNITLKVKAFTKPGTKFKIKWEGRSINGKTGDMFVIVNAKMPKELPPHIERMIEAIRYEI